MSGNGSLAEVDEPFTLHVAFAVESGPAAASPALKPRAAPGQTPGGGQTPGQPQGPTTPAVGKTPAAPAETPGQARAGASPLNPASSVSPPGAGSAVHLSPFGFLSFPSQVAGHGAPVKASQATLAHVRAMIPAHFPPSYLSQLVSAGALTSTCARALQSGSYYFMCANAGLPEIVAPPSDNTPAVTFLPVSPPQESHILARHCRPVLVLRSSLRPVSHISPKLGQHMSHLMSGAPPSQLHNFVQSDFLPSAPAIGRRTSFDLGAHTDSFPLLESHYGSPPIMARSVTTGTRTLGAIGDRDDEKMFRGPSRSTSGHPHEGPVSPRLRPHSTSHDAYRSLADGYHPVHFDDVIREKSSAHLLHGIPAVEERSILRPRETDIVITVTGELVEKPKRSTKGRTSGQRTPTRRHPINNMAAGMEVDDERVGSVKRFFSMEEFLNDEERRRTEYDAANAAHMAAHAVTPSEDTPPAAPSDASPSMGAMSGASASMPGSPPPDVEPLPQTPLWISLEDAGDRAIETIGRYFGLHPLTIEDCQSKGIREKLEVFPEYLFLVFHALDEVGGGHQPGHLPRHLSPRSSQANLMLQSQETDIMRTTPLKLVVFPSLVLSFHCSGLPSVAIVRKQLDKLYSNRVLNTAWLIHGLLDVVSDSLMPVVDVAAKEADDMEDLIYVINPGRESHKDVLRRMGAIARRLTFLRQRLWSKRDILTSLIEKDWQMFLTGVKVPYLRDIYDHLVIMLHKLDAGIEVIVTLQSTYLAVVSIDVAAVSNDGNKAMKTLSASATILLPLSLIASLMGMNVMVPFQFDAERISFKDLLPFSVICLCMLVISTTLYSYFKKQKYL